MHIRHISVYALAAGALVVTVLLVGDGGVGDGADAATEAVSGAVSDAVNEAAPAARDTAGAVVVQPDPVAPGTAFSVHDGGSCRGESATATFGDADIPAMQLPGQSGRTEGTAILPEGTAPGSYTVTLTCGGTSGARPSALDSGRDGDEDHGTAHGTEHGDGDAGGDTGGDAGGRGKESGDGRKTLTGTMTVSGGADGTVPLGGADTGLGGAAGTGRTATTAGGLLLMAAAGWGALARRRGTRS